jgi:hypothetical protein
MNQAYSETTESETLDAVSESHLRDLIARARGYIHRYPLATVGGAFAFGVVIGNGIPKFVAQTAVTMGLRALILRAIKKPSVEFEDFES